VNITGPTIRGANVYIGIPVTDKLMMVLWCLANREAYRVLSRRFALNRGNVHYIVMKTCRVLAQMSDRFIKWPAREQYYDLSHRFTLLNTLGNYSDQLIIGNI
jgi:hypothetical protein